MSRVSTTRSGPRGLIPDGISVLSPGLRNRLIVVAKKCPSTGRARPGGFPPNWVVKGPVLVVFIGPLGEIEGSVR